VESSGGQVLRRVLVTGAAGMLGSQLLRSAPRGLTCVGTDLAPAREDLPGGGVDLADEAALEALWQRLGPFDAVLHAAAFTAVDRAESEPELAARVNVLASAALARRCARSGARLVAVSTDFVFDGRSARAYRECDPPAPLSVYGRTKLEGEQAALAAHSGGTVVARTQWLYGPRGSHFPRTIVKLARERGELKVVDDQVGCPTSTLELAPALWDLARSSALGVFHAACEGSCSWHGFTRAILDLVGLGAVRLEPCSSAQFPRPAQRPAHSALDCGKLARLRGRTLKPWREALADYLAIEPL
jgi:dTDP-4-dehydrorhamnose reductase